MAVGKLLPDGEKMHDRKQAGLAEIGDLFGFEIGKELRDPRILVPDRLDAVGMQHRVELAGGQKRLDRFTAAEPVYLHAWRRVELHDLIELAKPFDRRLRDPVVVLEDTADQNNV